MSDWTLKLGTVLAEKYRLESVLGTGGMGTVYRAEHLALKAPVAVKVIDKEVSEGDVSLARFMREAQAAAALRSQHVVQILDYGTDGDRPYMVMEMLEGEPLSDRIKRLGRLGAAETFRVISHVAKAVSKAHEQDIIHRDLKPDNIFLVHNEGDEIAKVLDFGVAKVEATALDGEGHTRTGSLLGTPYYMSPEQAQGNKDIDSRSDLWALGVIAFECLTGTRPFSSDGLGDLVLQICIREIPVPSKFVPVPEGFDDWFKKACERELDARFQTARELAEALHGALGLKGEAAGSVPESRWAQTAAVEAKPWDPDTATTNPDHLSTRKDNDGNAKGTADPASVTQADDAEPLTEQTHSPSRWEVVPHPDGKSADAALEVPAALPKSGGGSIALVALLAVLLGGGLVFGLRSKAMDFLGSEKVPAPRLTVPKKGAAKVSPEETEPVAKPVRTPQVAGELDEKPPEENPAPDEPVTDEGVTKDTEPAPEGANGQAPPDKPSTDSLEAIESEAAAQLAERKKAEGSSTGNNPSPKPDPNQPTPVLPDSLIKAPAPPPPPTK